MMSSHDACSMLDRIHASYQQALHSTPNVICHRVMSCPLILSQRVMSCPQRDMLGHNYVMLRNMLNQMHNGIRYRNSIHEFEHVYIYIYVCVHT
jgi:hypothetical protein